MDDFVGTVGSVSVSAAVGHCDRILCCFRGVAWPPVRPAHWTVSRSGTQTDKERGIHSNSTTFC
jgi:hypothetical protein